MQTKEEKRAYQKAYKASPAGKAADLKHRNSPAAKAQKMAYMKEYSQRPEVKVRRKEYLKAYQERPEAKAREIARATKPERIAGRRAYIHRPDIIARNKEIDATPVRKAYFKMYAVSPIRKVQHARRRSLGWDVLNPEFRGRPDFVGHHIDWNHVIYIPRELHLMGHSLKKPETMERINTKVFCWLLGNTECLNEKK